MSNKFFVSSVLAISTLVFGANYFVLAPVNAVELMDGKKAFENSPRLTRAAANFNSRNSFGAKYQFTIEVPEDGGNRRFVQPGAR